MLAAASVAMAFALTACGDSPEEIAQETVKKMGETDMSSAYYWSKTTVDEYSKAIALINKIPDSELNNLSVCLGNSFAQPHQTYKVQRLLICA